MATTLRNMDTYVHDYWSAQSFLGRLTERKLAHNTYVVKDGDRYAVRYHTTNIVTYTPNHAIVNTNGWTTSTTSFRINKLIPMRFSIFQKNWKWYVWDRDNDTTFDYHDGMVFDM